MSSETKSIASLVQNCLAAFKRNPELGIESTQTHDELDNELGRFRTWAGNVSAHTTGLRSLQYRLRDSSALTTAVLRYLSELLKVLDLIARLALGEPIDGSVDDDDDTEYSSDEEADSMFDGNTQDTRAELASAVEDVNEIVTCLLRISVTLRNPARNDQIRCSDTISAKFFEPRDIEHTRMKFPEAQEYLVERLGKGISRHRQYFKYRQEHHQKLAAGLDADAYDPAQIQSTIATSVPVQEEEPTRPSGFGWDAESVYTDTSFAPTISGESSLRPPPRPPGGDDGQPFECPICYGIVIAEDELTWRRHVFEDIPPYMCTNPRCKTGSRQYNRRRDWEHHMKMHDRFWSCPYETCQDIFGTEQKLREHLLNRHGQNLGYTALHSIASSCSNSEGKTKGSFICPLCKEKRPTSKLWYKHVGHHLGGRRRQSESRPGFRPRLFRQWIRPIRVGDPVENEGGRVPDSERQPF